MSTFDPTVARGFFRTLFDFNFQSFLTLKFIKFIYAIVVILIGLGALVFLIALFAKGLGWGILGLILAPIFGLCYLIITRIELEVVAVLFRIGENTSILVGAAGAPSPVSPAGPRGPFPSGGPQPGGPFPGGPSPYGG